MIFYKMKFMDLRKTDKFCDINDKKMREETHIYVFADEINVPSFLVVTVDHSDEQWWLRSLQIVFATAVRYEANCLDQINKILYYSSGRLLHVQQQQPTNYPVRVPIVQLCEPSTRYDEPANE